MIKKLFLIPLSFLLIGCVDTLNVKTSAIDPTIVQPENPAPVQMYPIVWNVVTRENLKPFLDKMAASQSTDNVVFVAVDVKTYENIRLNFDDLRRYIEQQQAIIVYYKNITAPAIK